MDNSNEKYRQDKEKDQACPTDSAAGVTTTGNANVVRRESEHSQSCEPVDLSATKSNPELLLQSGVESITITTRDGETGDVHDLVEESGSGQAAAEDLDENKGNVSHDQSARSILLLVYK